MLKKITRNCKWLIPAFLFFVTPVFASDADTGQQTPPVFAWMEGPMRAEMGTKAHVNLKDGQIFLNAAETEKFLVANGNPAAPNSYTLASKTGEWFSIFNFIGDGYVKDDEKIDPDNLLSMLKSNNEKALEIRRQQNLALLYLDGWHTPPHYDTQTKRLEWAIKLHDQNNAPVINFTTRILGRGGYMSATLVSDPKNLEQDIKSFKSVLAGYEFNQGEKYSEFTSGDKVAAYGLGALVVGGAAAAVASKGGFKFLGYLIFGGLAAFGAFFKKIFTKNK